MTPHPTRLQRFIKPAHRLIAAATLLLLAGGAAGCGVVPWIVTQFRGPEKVKPKYEFPPEKTILVFVENDPALGYLSGVELVRADLANLVSALLVEHKVAARTVSQARLQNALEQLPERAAISEVGKRCDADFVLYVQIEKLSFQDIPNTTLYTGRMKTSVKVIDVNQGKVFPPVETKHSVPQITLPPVDENSPTYANVVAGALIVKMADNITKLFYEHEKPRSEPMSLE
ncbi:MAG: hypothetical protein FWE88_08440 [Phycisphaerae bacterium]|nr:hypothetical protein [Phycisphaerae bacterium]